MLHHIKVKYNEFKGENLSHEAFITIHPDLSAIDQVVAWVLAKDICNVYIIETSSGQEVWERIL